MFVVFVVLAVFAVFAVFAEFVVFAVFVVFAAVALFVGVVLFGTSLVLVLGAVELAVVVFVLPARSGIELAWDTRAECCPCGT